MRSLGTSTVIPGRRAAASPEPMNTTDSEEAARAMIIAADTMFMGSGLGPPGRPGMTKRPLS